MNILSLFMASNGLLPPTPAQDLALFRGDGGKRCRHLVHLVAAAFRANDLLLIVFAKGQHDLEGLFADFAEILINWHKAPVIFRGRRAFRTALRLVYRQPEFGCARALSFTREGPLQSCNIALAIRTNLCRIGILRILGPSLIHGFVRRICACNLGISVPVRNSAAVPIQDLRIVLLTPITALQAVHRAGVLGDVVPLLFFAGVPALCRSEVRAD